MEFAGDGLHVGGVAWWDWDMASDQVAWSGAIETIFGSAEACPQTRAAWMSRIHPEEHGAVADAMARHLREHTPYDVTYRWRRDDGSYVWWRDTGHPGRRRAGGGTRRLTGVCADVTHLKGMEEELRRHNRELELLNRVMAVTAADLEPKMAMNMVCRELAQAFAVSQARAMVLNEARTAVTVVAEYRGPGAPSMLGLEIPLATVPTVQGGLVRGEKVLICTDALADPRLAPYHGLLQQYGTASLVLWPLVVDNLTVAYLLLISEQRRIFTGDEIALAVKVAGQVSGTLARVRLGEIRRFLMAAIEQTPESIIITDTQARILYVNPTFEKNTGYSRAEVQGQTPRLLKSGRHDVAFVKALWDTIAAGQVWHGCLINRNKDGSFCTVDALVAPVRDPAGVITHYIGINRDITRERELEEHVRQVQKLDSIGRLAGGMAHDFNNILTAIQGHADLALLNLAPDAPARLEVIGIVDGAERAAALTRQLLAFARHQPVESQPVDLNGVISHLGNMLTRLIGEQIELALHLAPDTGRIMADPGQLEQILVNLVVNARDAMPRGGVLSIRTANVTLAAGGLAHAQPVAPGDYVAVMVSDTGVGMSPEARAHVFEPFFTTKPAGQGTGLGLATCFGIIQRGHGHIRFEDNPGGGTTFTVYLPRVREATPANEAGAGTAAQLPRGTEKVLLVEDEKPLRRITLRALRAQGYDVTEVANGLEALAKIQASGAGYQLLVTDVMMPGLNGRAVFEQARVQLPGLRVLFMSGYPDLAVVQESVRTPGSRFLKKPFSLSELVHQTRAALDD